MKLTFHFFGRVFRFSPARASVAIFDLQDDLTASLNSGSYVVFDPRFREIYLKPFIVGILKWLGSHKVGTLTEHYFVAFLRISSPKLVLTTIDNNANFYAAKKHYSNVDSRFIAIQNGCRWRETMPPTASNLRSRDMILCLTADYVSAWREVSPNATILPTGSYASKVPRVKPKTEKGVAGFISTWKPGIVVADRRMKQTHYGQLIEHSEFYGPEISLLPLLKTALQGLDFKLHVIGRSTGQLQKVEREFYSQILGEEGWVYEPRVGVEPSYSSIWRYEILFCVTTTLAYEALALGHRVMFLDSSPQGASEQGSPAQFRQPFGYPNTKERSQSVFHLQKSHTMQWQNQIGNVLSMTEASLENELCKLVGSVAMKTSYENMVSLFDV